MNKKVSLYPLLLCGLGCFFLMGINENCWSAEPEKIKENPLVLSLSRTDTERPPVLFSHDSHVNALTDKGCRVCHPTDSKGDFSFIFPKNRNNKNKKTLMRSYHAECIGCHKNIHKAHKKSGPVICGKCHLKNNEPINNTDWSGAHFDFHSSKSHANVEKECSTCHHTEVISSCTQCHLKKDKEDVPSLKKAAHNACLKCHWEYSAARFSCETCHSKQDQVVKESSLPSLTSVKPYDH